MHVLYSNSPRSGNLGVPLGDSFETYGTVGPMDKEKVNPTTRTPSTQTPLPTTVPPTTTGVPSTTVRVTSVRSTTPSTTTTEEPRSGEYSTIVIELKMSDQLGSVANEFIQ